MKKKIAAVAGTAVIAVLLTACGGGTATTSDSAPTGTANEPAVSQGVGSADASADVVLGAGAADDFGLVQLPATITNSSEKRSDYLITVAANAPDGTRVDETFITVTGLEPGQSAAESATFLKPDLPEGLTFAVLTVQRTASL